MDNTTDAIEVAAPEVQTPGEVLDAVVAEEKALETRVEALENPVTQDATAPATDAAVTETPAEDAPAADATPAA